MSMAQAADVGIKPECPALFWGEDPDDGNDPDEELELKVPALELPKDPLVIEEKSTVGSVDTVCHVPPEVVVLGS